MSFLLDAAARRNDEGRGSVLCSFVMIRKILRRFGVGLLATVIVVGSFGVWAYFTQRKMDAREQEVLDRRYPVKAGKPKAKTLPAPLPVREAAGYGIRPESPGAARGK